MFTALTAVARGPAAVGTAHGACEIQMQGQPTKGFFEGPFVVTQRFFQGAGSDSKEDGMTKTAAKDTNVRSAKDAHVRERLGTPTDLKVEATRDISAGLAGLLADVFALYLKTKNFHWHMSGPHFRDYHLLLDEQADQIYAMTDPIAERIRKVGGTTLRSIGHIAKLQRIKDNDADYVDAQDMLAELREDNQSLAARLREVHDVVDEVRDIATASLIENWIDETERRTWFLFEASRHGDATGH